MKGAEPAADSVPDGHENETGAAESGSGTRNSPAAGRSQAEAKDEAFQSHDVNSFRLNDILDVVRSGSGPLSLLALGTDLTTLGLNLNAPESLFNSFVSPTVDQQPSRDEVELHLPPCYHMTQSNLRMTHLQKFTVGTLFYMFYTIVGDVLQGFAAAELFNRGWIYHSVYRKWFTTVDLPENRSRNSENGDPAGNCWVYFEPSVWAKRLYYGDLDVSKFVKAEALRELLGDSQAGRQEGSPPTGSDFVSAMPPQTTAPLTLGGHVTTNLTRFPNPPTHGGMPTDLPSGMPTTSSLPPSQRPPMGLRPGSQPHMLPGMPTTSSMPDHPVGSFSQAVPANVPPSQNHGAVHNALQASLRGASLPYFGGTGGIPSDLSGPHATGHSQGMSLSATDLGLEPGLNLSQSSQGTASMAALQNAVELLTRGLQQQQQLQQYQQQQHQPQQYPQSFQQYQQQQQFRQ